MSGALILLRAANLAALAAGAGLLRGRAAAAPAVLCAAVVASQAAARGRLASAPRLQSSLADASCLLDLLLVVLCVHWLSAWRAGLETAAIVPALLLAASRGPWAGAAAGAFPVLAAAGLGSHFGGRPWSPYDPLAALLCALPPAAAGIVLPEARLRGARAALRASSRLRRAQFGEYLGLVGFQLRDYATTLSTLAEAVSLPGAAEDPKTPERLERMKRAVSELSAKISRLLGEGCDFTTLHPQQSSVDLAALVREVARAAGEACAGPGVSVAVDIPRPLPPLTGDRRNLEWALFSVLQNALEACARAGGGCVRVRAEDAGGSAAIEVADEGGGIPPERLEAVFEPLHSAGPDGVGLGLSMARRFLERSGGSLSVRASPTGAEVVLQIPLRPDLPRVRNEDSTWAGRRSVSPAAAAEGS